MDRKFNLILKFYEGDSDDADLGPSAKRSFAFQCLGDRTIQQLAAGIIAHYKKATTCDLRIKELRDGNGSSLSSDALVEDCFTPRADAKGSVELYTVQVIRETASAKERARLKRDGTVILGGSLDLSHVSEADAASYEAEAQQERLQLQEQGPKKKRRREESVSHRTDSAVPSIEDGAQVSPKRRRLNSQTSQPSVQITLSQPQQHKPYVLPKSESMASQTSTSATAVNTNVQKTITKVKSTVPGAIPVEDLWKLTERMKTSQMKILPRTNSRSSIPRSPAPRSPAPPKSSKPTAKVAEVPVASSDDSGSSASDDGSEIPAVAPRNDQSHSPARAVSSSDGYDDDDDDEEAEEDDDSDGNGDDDVDEGGSGGDDDGDDENSEEDSDGEDDGDEQEDEDDQGQDEEHVDERGEALSETSEQTAVEVKPTYRLVGPAKEPIGVESESSSQDGESVSELCAPADKQFDLLTDNQSSDGSRDLPVLPGSRLTRKPSQATTVSPAPSTQDRLNTQLHSENSQAFPAISQEKPPQSSQFGTIPTPTPAALNQRNLAAAKRGGLGTGGTPARSGGRAVFTSSRAKDSNTGSLTALLQSKRAEKASQAKSPAQMDPRKFFNTSAEADDDDDSEEEEEEEDDDSDDEESNSEDSEKESSKRKRKRKQTKKKSGRNKTWDAIISSVNSKKSTVL